MKLQKVEDFDVREISMFMLYNDIQITTFTTFSILTILLGILFDYWQNASWFGRKVNDIPVKPGFHITVREPVTVCDCRRSSTTCVSI